MNFDFINSFLERQNDKSMISWGIRLLMLIVAIICAIATIIYFIWYLAFKPTGEKKESEVIIY